jgi:Asp-tRNA(Asn)/Glu-tRNA(Gln) amidotransferase A subunit family amidase
MLNTIPVRGCARAFSGIVALLAVMLAALTSSAALQNQPVAPTAIDRDLTEITAARLAVLYAARSYTVTQVTTWHLDRIGRYDGVYRSMLDIDRKGALAAAAALDAEAREKGASLKRGPLWGVPMVVKANTSVKGLVTSNGWWGYLVPGHELRAPRDATIITKLRAAGSIILGHTNMPDFASGDTTRSTAGGRTGNAYNPRFSPGGSSGGTVTAVAASFAVFGTGTDTSNSIRTPSAASGLVGMIPTRGLVSIYGVHPYNWLIDNAGPIARNVTDTALALEIMAGEDKGDFRTAGSAARAPARPYAAFLKRDALKGKRFGVPSFMLNSGSPPLERETRELFLKALAALRAEGATVVMDDAILPRSFSVAAESVLTRPYLAEGIEAFLKDFGPAAYHSTREFEKAAGFPVQIAGAFIGQSARPFQGDPSSDANFFTPQRRALAMYEEAMTRFQLDGFVYPAMQTPANDETRPETAAIGGPHSDTGWVNILGAPAIVVPAGAYANGLPFGVEFSARPWKDGDLLGWAYAYEQATKVRRAPVLAN